MIIMRLNSGYGLSNSATNGASIVRERAKKLHIPIAVARLRSGKTASLLKDERYATYQVQLMPTLTKKARKGINLSI